MAYLSTADFMLIIFTILCGAQLNNLKTTSYTLFAQPSTIVGVYKAFSGFSAMIYGIPDMTERLGFKNIWLNNSWPIVHFNLIILETVIPQFRQRISSAVYEIITRNVKLTELYFEPW